MRKYFQEIQEKVDKIYGLAGQARTKGLDPLSTVEISLATSLAERAVALVAIIYPQVKSSGIEKRIKELEKEYGFLDHAVCLKIAEEVAKEKFCKFKSFEEAFDAGIRVAFAYYTLGVVSSPLEGYTHFKIKKTRDGKDYICVYYSGPIRSAGASAAAFSLLIIDYLREMFGYAKYDPSEQEIKRMSTEVYDYHERVTNLQYLPSVQEVEFLFSNVPIQVNGDPSEEREVSNYKDLERVETNRIRNGPCLVLAEGLAQKAPKTLKALTKLRNKGFKLSDWDFLDKFVKLQKEIIEKKKKVASATYMQDAVAGRPIFGHPSRTGGFRLRYGRSRVSGYSAVALNPMTMKVVGGFIATATQLKLEKPTKSAVVGVCESVDGPIIKLDDDSVVQPRTEEQFARIENKVKEVLYLGDILISYGDFYNRNHVLLPCGYVPEWWLVELKEVAIKYTDPDFLKNKTQKELDEVQRLLNGADQDIGFDEAFKISVLFGVPLHPNFIFYWSQIEYNGFLELLKWLQEAKIIDNKIILPYETHKREQFKQSKRALEILGTEHLVSTANVVIDNANVFLSNLGLNLESSKDLDDFSQKFKRIIEKAESFESKNVLEFINTISGLKIKDKAGTFIGARMGRPEKAKPRELKGSPHVLFPVGEEGGKLRSFQTALEKGSVKADFPVYFCEQCGKESVYFMCETCEKQSRQMHYCKGCDKKIFSESCELHGKARPFLDQHIDINRYYQSAVKKAGLGNTLKIVKGVRGTSSEKHIPENLVKGILRASFNLHVNKDGTIRYDAIETPITQFKPKEVFTPISKLKELGYEKDVDGNNLESSNQVLELKPHDIILPCAKDSLDEKAGDFFVRVAGFIDNLLTNFYGLPAFYNVSSREDLVGHLTLCIAPHNCAGVVGRIIGFSDTHGFYASPYMHAAMRRDCDGDEAAILLLLDALINFSRQFLPTHRGATQDAPLVLNSRIRANEVDDMIFDMDIVKNYPLELYMAAEQGMMPNTVRVEQISSRIGKEEFDAFKNLFYTHKTNDFNSGVSCSAYKLLATMPEKVEKEMAIIKKLRSVDASDVARLIIERHFLRDIKGNFGKFTQQQFRCVGCNEKYRRPPLAGKCIKVLNNGNFCGGRIIFTIAEGSIVKYLEPTLMLAKKFELSPYLQQSLFLLKQSIESVFGKETEKQIELKKWF
jgi:DNA polymerase II large subunit